VNGNEIGACADGTVNSVDFRGKLTGSRNSLAGANWSDHGQPLPYWRISRIGGREHGDVRTNEI
jgi:hypothetical protein